MQKIFLSSQRFLFVALPLIVATCSLSGCYSSNRKLFHPNTGHSVDCSAWGFGWLGAPVAYASTQSCLSSHHDLGYIDGVAPATNSTKSAAAKNSSSTSVEADSANDKTQPDSAAADESKEVIQWLQKLRQARDDGLITEEEYQRKRKDKFTNF